MSLEHAILGFLNYEPLSGYDLKKVFDTSVQHFWPANQSQIYRTLARLADHGWVEMEIIEQLDRPDRKLYHITQAGRQELRRWLLAPLQAPETRSPQLIQVFFAGQLSDEQILEIFERAAEHMRGLLERYERVPGQVEEYTNRIDSPRETFFWMLTLDLGVRSARAHLEWIESVIQTIRSKGHPDK